jgi:hypothetical protein
MALNAKKIGGGGQGGNRVQQDNIEPGVYPGRLVQIIDLGLQPQRPFQGKDKPPAQEIMLTYELVDEFMKDEDGNPIEDKPRWISETLPFFGLQADKAKSTQRYNALDPQGDLDGDFAKAIEFPVNVTIVNNAVGEKIYDNISGLSPMRPRDAANCPALKNPSKVFDLDAPDLDVFLKFPQWIQDKIKANLNFAGSPLEARLKGVKGDAKPAPQKPAKEAKKPVAEDPPFEPDDAEDNPY